MFELGQSDLLFMPYNNYWPMRPERSSYRTIAGEREELRALAFLACRIVEVFVEAAF